MEDDLNFFQMEDNLNCFQMKYDLNFFQIEDDLNVIQIKNNLTIHATGRQPQKKIMQPKEIKIKTMAVAPLRVN